MTSHRHKWRPRGVFAALTVFVVVACSSTPTLGTSSTPGSAITVAAAASLTEAFTKIGEDFETKNAASRVTFSFASSATLATQIAQGAPIDVYAAASSATMQTVIEAGAANRPVDFASNTLQIAVPKGNPGKITGLEDFADKAKKIAICAPQVPCGAAAVKVFASAKIVPAPDTLEQDVKATLQKVQSNEVDAALVYKTDVLAARHTVDGLEFAEARQAINVYPIATVAASKDPALAQRFVDYVLSSDGQAVLNEAGFDKP
jgi:molybdate transport system substrate-binding protein